MPNKYSGTRAPQALANFKGILLRVDFYIQPRNLIFVSDQFGNNSGGMQGTGAATQMGGTGGAKQAENANGGFNPYYAQQASPYTTQAAQLAASAYQQQGVFGSNQGGRQQQFTGGWTQ